MIRKARARLASLVKDLQWDPAIVASLEPLFDLPHETPLTLEHPGLALPFDPENYDGLLLSVGYLVIGTCPNGDMIVLDGTQPVPPVLYVSHEEFDYDECTREYLSEITRPVARSASEFFRRVLAGTVPDDYFDGPRRDV